MEALPSLDGLNATLFGVRDGPYILEFLADVSFISAECWPAHATSSKCAAGGHLELLRLGAVAYSIITPRFMSEFPKNTSFPKQFVLCDRLSFIDAKVKSEFCRSLRNASNHTESGLNCL